MGSMPLMGAGPTSPVPLLTAVVAAIPDAVAYWPLNEGSGTAIVDALGGGRGGVSSGVALAQVGQLGRAYTFAATGELVPNAAFTAALNPAEFSVSMFVKITATPGAPDPYRLHNMFLDSTNEYSSAEIRSSNNIGAFLKENTVTQSNSEFEILALNAWYHIVFFNSVIADQFGFYINRLFLPAERATPGLVVTTIDANYPKIGTKLVGSVQHVAWFNRLITQAEVDGLYYGGFAHPSTSPEDVWDDDYLTTESNPLVTPRTSEPGPGTGVFTDTGNLLSISTSNLRWVNKTIDAADPRFISSSTFARKVGRASMGVLTTGMAAMGWGTINTASPTRESILFRNGVVFVNTVTSQLNLESYGVFTYKTASPMRRYGALHLIKGGAFTEWTLLYVSKTSVAAWYAGVGAWNVNTTNAVDKTKVVDLPYPFNDDFGLATTRLPAGRTAGDTFTHEADCLLTFVMGTRPSAGVVDFRFRQQDATNYWQVTVDSAGGLKMNEVVAGVSTERGTSAAGANSGWQITVICRGTTIQVLTLDTSDQAVSRITYASATGFATETDGVLANEGTAGVINDIVAWPRTLGAGPAAILDAALA